MRNTTTQLLHQARNTDDIFSFLSAHENDFLQESIGSYLKDLLEEKGMKIADVAKRSMQGNYLYKVFSDEGERKISRDVFCAIALAMELDYEQTQFLMRISGNAALDPRLARDAVILFGVEKHISVADINDTLDSMKIEPLKTR